MSNWLLIIGVLVVAFAVVIVLMRSRKRQTPPTTDDRIMEMTELAGGLAHELRNPLSTLLLNLKLLDEDLREGLDEESDVLRRGRMKIQVARGEAERLQRLLDEFLMLAGPVGLKLEAVDVNSVVGRLADFYRPEAQRNRITLRVDVPREPVWCSLDVQIFQQAILNLLVNAQQAMPDGGETILRVRREADAVTFEVIDTGEGMDDVILAKALAPFYSTKPRGSGLGLPTTNRIICAHGGRLSIESTPGVGSRFRIRLPAVQAPG